MLTSTQLHAVMPTLGSPKIDAMLPPLNAAMHDFAVDNVLRAAAFLAQLAHESGEFKWMEEIWGPTAAQRNYEPTSALAARLGNTQAGDGKLFKGRGPIQITGRFNYGKYGGLLGVDLVASPELAATPAAAFSIAGLYWTANHLNELADREDFVGITRRINGGLNGLVDRQKYYERAKQALAGGVFGDEDAPPTGARGMARRQPPALPANLEPLTRGSEAIADWQQTHAGGSKSKSKTEGRATPGKTT